MTVAPSQRVKKITALCESQAVIFFCYKTKILRYIQAKQPLTGRSTLRYPSHHLPPARKAKNDTSPKAGEATAADMDSLRAYEARRPLVYHKQGEKSTVFAEKCPKALKSFENPLTNAPSSDKLILSYFYEEKRQ